MSDQRDHDAFRDLLPMAALDALSSEERAALDAHLATCAECRREVTELRDVAGSIAASLPAKPMSPERDSLLRARLMARAVADRADVTPIRGAAPASHMHHAAPTPRTGWRWLAAASLLIAVAAVGYGARQRAMIDELLGPGVRVIDAGAASARDPYARMFWDPPTKHWTFVAYQLPVAGPRHAYQLWIITSDQKKVSAGVFTPDASGHAVVHVTYEPPGDSIAAIAVTDEPEGGSPQPTTTPILVGSAAKSD